MLVVNLLSCYSDIGVRGYYKEFVELAKQGVIVFLLGVLYLYSVQDAHKFSRLTMVIMGALFFVFDYSGRVIWKKRTRQRGKADPDRSVLIISDITNVGNAIRNIENSIEMPVRICGVVLTDGSECEYVGKYPAVCPLDDAPAYICHNWVDDVLIVLAMMKEVENTPVRYRRSCQECLPN